MKAISLIITLTLFLPATVQAACEYTYTTDFSGSESERMTIILIPDGFAGGESSRFDSECADHVCSHGDSCATGKMWESNWYGDNKQFFDVIRLTGDNGECTGADALWYNIIRTEPEKAALINTLLNQPSPPAADCNFLSSQACRTLPVIITDQDPISGGTEERGGEAWTFVGWTMYDYEIPHEFGHAGIADILCDEYNADIAGPGQGCWGAQSGGAAEEACINLNNRNSNEKWSSYVPGSPYEGGAYCNEDVWRPTENTIMRGGDVSGDFDALGYEAMDKGLYKRLGVIESDNPSVDCDLNQDDVVSGIIAVTCTVTDASDIEFVEFSIARSGDRHYFAGFDNSAPYTIDIDTTDYQDSVYYLLVTAWDEHWNPGQDNPRFTISNQVSGDNSIYPSSDFNYLGAFRLPTPPSTNYRWGDRELAGSYYPNGDPGDTHNNAANYPGSLYLMVTEWQNYFPDRFPVEISIPTPIDEPNKNMNNLNEAIFLQTPGEDITDGEQSNGNYWILGDVEYLPQQAGQTSDYLYWSAYNHYTGYLPSDEQLGYANLDFTNTAKIWDLSGQDAREYGKYIFEIPSSWADTHSNSQYLLTGYMRHGGGESLGPTAFSYAPWQHGDPPASSTALGNTELLNYEGNAGGYPYTNILEEASPGDWWGDGAWLEIGDKRAVMFAGTKSDRSWNSMLWQYSDPPIDSCGDGKGYHAWPRYGMLLFYDEDDLAKVADGTMQPHEPQPYVRAQLMGYLYSDNNNGCPKEYIHAVGYDRANNLLYLQEADTEIVHVFELVDNGMSADTTPPSAATGLQATNIDKTSIDLIWTAATDPSGGIAYKIYRNGRPIAVVDDTYWTDSNPEYYVSPYTYKVRAMDFSHNHIDSTELEVTSSNDPLVFFIAIGGPIGIYEDEVSHLPVGVIGEPYSFTFAPIGGVPPYTWSGTGSFFNNKGLGLDPDTGVLSGTPDASAGFYRATITVTDSAGNIYSRLITMQFVSDNSAYNCDRDYDGYDSNSGGCSGTDTNDQDYNINPSNPTMDSPTNIQLNGNILSWTKTSEDDLSTYTVHYGPSTGTYTGSVFAGSADSYDISGLTGPYFAVTAFDVRGLESPYSQEAQESGTHRADTSGGGCVDMGELLDFIDLWFTDSQDVTMSEVMQAITLWKAQTGCPEP